ncbi:hypothetical protein [Aridibaculum aurantiacum]|uniref:hypothetical protein n=1 Tax=Aridibaculum aurantiacum TaxID=2810307 RepID=UPI001A961405|nr:hypothetical protein [Aridibaculum aurantiacum]
MKRKRIYYVPGLISLIGLPIMFFLCPIEDPVQPNALRILLPRDEVPKNSEPVFSRDFVLENLKSKKITRVYLESFNGYYPEERGRNLAIHQRAFIESEIKRLQFSRDTTTALQVVLDEEASYNDFVALVNLTAVYDIKRWAYLDDNFIFWANDPPPPPIVYEQLDPITIDDYEQFKVVMPSQWELFKWEVQAVWEEIAFYSKRNKLLIAGFILLVIIPSVRWTKRNSVLRS